MKMVVLFEGKHRVVVRITGNLTKIKGYQGALLKRGEEANIGGELKAYDTSPLYWTDLRDPGIWVITKGDYTKLKGTEVNEFGPVCP